MKEILEHLNRIYETLQLHNRVLQMLLNDSIAKDKDIDEQTKEYFEYVLKKEPIKKEPVHTGYTCFHCGSDSVFWGAYFTFEDYGLDGEGIVHACYCDNCGADIEYYVPIVEEEDDKEGD